MATKNVPKLRFKGFTEEWEEKELGEFGYVAMNKRIYKNQTAPVGDVPFYKIGTFGGTPDSYISRELFNEFKQKYPYPEVGDILISASGSIGRLVEYKGADEYFQDSNIIWLAHDERLSNIFLKQLFTFIKWSGLEGSTIKRLYNKNVLETVFMLPNTKHPTKSIDEQKQIGEFFQNIDNLINANQTKLNKLKNIKKACLEKMFPRRGATTPEIRFKGFTGEWEEKKLGDIAPLRGGFAFQNDLYGNDGIPIVRISNILPNGSVGGEFVFYQSFSNDSGFVLENGDVLIAMSGATTGKVAIVNNKYKKYYQNQRVGLFSKSNSIEYTFISILVRSELFLRQLKDVLVAGAQPNVSSKDIDSFKFHISKNKKEQTKIGTFFKNLDNLISKNEQKLTKLKNIKKACLEKMFVNKEDAI